MRVTGAKRNQKITVVDTTTITSGPKPRIHNIMVIDASGSMEGDKYHNAIAGVNNNLKSIKEDTDTINTIMIVEFEGYNIVRRVDVTSDIPATYRGMGTDGSTPLNQAVAETLEYIIKRRKSDFNVADKVLVNVFTDGEENSSQGKWRGPSGAALLGQLIASLEAEGVTVTFVGTKTEVNYAIQHLNLRQSNTLVHDNTAQGLMRSFDATVRGRQLYSKSVAKGEDVTESFYSKTLQPDEDNK